MEPEERKQHWENVYATKTENEVSWFQTSPGISLDLLARASVKSSSKIVDVGGGASRLVDALLDSGFSQVTVLDIASHSLEMTQKRLGSQASKVKWLAADITQWIPNDIYDVWHDRAVFHFLTDENDRAAYKKALQAGLHSGGTVIIASFALDGPEWCSGLPVQRYSPYTLAQELGDDFKLIDSLSQDHQTPFGTVQKFQFSRFCRL